MAESDITFETGTVAQPRSEYPEAVRELMAEFAETYPDADFKEATIENRNGWISATIHGETIHD